MAPRQVVAGDMLHHNGDTMEMGVRYSCDVTLRMTSSEARRGNRVLH